MATVYQGVAKLDIKQFVDGLKKLRAEAESTEKALTKTFNSIKNNVNSATNAIEADAKRAAAAITGLGTAISGVSAQNLRTPTARAATPAAGAGAAATRAAKISQSQAFAAEIAELRAHNNVKLQEQKRAAQSFLNQQQNEYSTMLQTANSGNIQEAVALRTHLANRRQMLQNDAAMARESAIRAANEQAAAKAAVTAATEAKDIAGIQAAKRKFEDSSHAARMAAQKEATYLKALTQTERTERQIQVAIAKRAAEEKAHANRGTISGAWQNELNNLKKVEDELNSIFRAGSQISQIGARMTMLAAVTGGVGLALVNTAAEFDFWATRAVAAARAADTTGNSIANAEGATEVFKQAIHGVGRELGVLRPDQLAQGFYLYQAAVGTAINTTEDLETALAGVETMMKAAIISGTSPEDAIRGVTQAMAEFSMGAEDAMRATALLLNVTSITQAEFSDMTQAFKMVGPQAKELGMTMEEVASVIAKLSDFGIRGTMAGRALQMTLENIIAPSDKAARALSEVFGGAWRDVVFEQGQFIGLVDKQLQSGEMQIGFFHRFAEATRGWSEVQRQAAISTIFTQNATRIVVPLVEHYASALDEAARTGRNVNDILKDQEKSLNSLYQRMADGDRQGKLFSEQWGLVSETIKVRLGKALYELRVAVEAIGTVAAEALIPLIEWVGRVISRYMQWANANKETATTLLRLAGMVAIVAGVLGPLMFILGNALQSLAGFRIALTTLAGVMRFAGTTIMVLTRGLIFLNPLVLLGVGLILLMAAAWKAGLFDMGEAAGQLGYVLQIVLGGLGRLVEAFLKIIMGLLAGDKAMIIDGANQVAEALIQIFIVAGQELAGLLLGILAQLGVAIGSFMGQLASAFVTWGYNLVISLANGMLQAGAAAVRAAYQIAWAIAAPFMSFSPPKVGPLKNIQLWGRHLIESLLAGMAEADLKGIEEVSGQISDALMAQFQAGNITGDQYVEGMQLAYAQIAEMLMVPGSNANFEPLREFLGEWYDQIVAIATQYETINETEKALSFEKQKLEVLRKQTEELKEQHSERNSAFDQALSASAGLDYTQHQGEMVDPLSAGGKAKIDEMRRSLSTEDFQNWIGWQKKLWDQKQTIEAETAQAAEDAQATVVDTLQAQLDILNQQYATAVKLFELTQAMLNIEKPTLVEEAVPEVPEVPIDNKADSEDLRRAREEMRAVTGADTQMLPEGSIPGDIFERIGVAGDQTAREEQRIKDLDAAYRKRQAELEAAEIAAKGDEEKLAQIAKEKEALRVAHQEEKARLQERVQFAKEVEEALESERANTAAARVAEMEKEFQKEIRDVLGDQNGTIKDSNQLKSENKDLDEAAKAAAEQTQVEQDALNKLQDAHKQKQLDFERRIREAGDNKEKIAKIKEEQEAWEAAYKAAELAQQQRIDAARKAEEELRRQQQEAREAEMERERAEREAREGGAGGAGGPRIPGGGGGPELPKGPTIPHIPGGPGIPFEMPTEFQIPEIKLNIGEVKFTPPTKETLKAEGFWADVKSLMKSIGEIGWGNFFSEMAVVIWNNFFTDLLGFEPVESIQEISDKIGSYIIDAVLLMIPGLGPALVVLRHTVWAKIKEGIFGSGEGGGGSNDRSGFGTDVTTNPLLRLIGDMVSGAISGEGLGGLLRTFAENFMIRFSANFAGMAPGTASAWATITAIGASILGAAWDTIAPFFQPALDSVIGAIATMTVNAGIEWAKFRDDPIGYMVGEGGLVPTLLENFGILDAETSAKLFGEGGLIARGLEKFEQFKNDPLGFLVGPGGLVPTLLEKFGLLDSDTTSKLFGPGGLIERGIKAFEKFKNDPLGFLTGDGGLIPKLIEDFTGLDRELMTKIFGPTGLIATGIKEFEKFKNDPLGYILGVGGLIPELLDKFSSFAADIAGWLWAGPEALIPNALKKFQEFSSNVIGWFVGPEGMITKVKPEWSLFAGAIEGMMSRIDVAFELMAEVRRKFDERVAAVKAGLDALRRAWESFKELARSIGAAPGPPEANPGGETGFDPGHRDGLYRVPFDGYRAILHAGERVLTAAEAARYNALEKINGLRTAVQTIVVQQASTPTAPNVSKTANFFINRVDAGSQNGMNTFLEQAAYLTD